MLARASILALSPARSLPDRAARSCSAFERRISHGHRPHPLRHLWPRSALRGVVRKVLVDAAKNGLPGEHHFYISFNTRADGVRLSPRMRAQYPEEMTVVLQHQFWDLVVTESGFEVGVSFGGIPERVAVPVRRGERLLRSFGAVWLAVRGDGDAEAAERKPRVSRTACALHGQGPRRSAPAGGAQGRALRAAVPVAANPEPAKTTVGRRDCDKPAGR